MRKYSWVYRYNKNGVRNGMYHDVGLDPDTGELHNPNAYNATDLRRAIARAEERMAKRYEGRTARRATMKAKR
jgi:hypothetical protein